MEPNFESHEWQEAMRLLHKFVPLSAFITRPQDLGLDEAGDIIEAWDPTAVRQPFALQESEGSGDAFLRVVGAHGLTGLRALVIPDVGCGWPDYFPFVCNDQRLHERLNEELARETLLNSKDTFIVLESGVLALFDHEYGVTVGVSRIVRAEQDEDDQAAAAVGSKP